MEAQQILQSDILDILFEGKNKLYGAYDLRKTYNKRIATALFTSLLLIAAIFISTVVARRFHQDPIITAVNIIPETIVHEAPKDMPKPPQVLKPSPPSHVQTVRVTKPIITIDKLVSQIPPDVKQIEKAIIDIKLTPGNNDIGINYRPADMIGTNVAANPVSKKSKEDSVLKIVQIEATFPGGLLAWQRYIQRAITAELDEFTDSDYGTCIVNFIVDKNGKVSNVQATTMKGTKLAEIAVKTIKNGPNWVPAIQNGNYVNAYRTQPVTLVKPNE